MNKYFYFLTVLFFLITAPFAYARDGQRGEDRGRSQEQRAEIRVENEVEDEIEIEDENEERAEVRQATPQRVEINNNRFEIRGEITSVSGNSFVIASQTVTIDPSQVNEFKQKGILQTGRFAKVEGRVINGTKFAQEIRVTESIQTALVVTPTATPTPTPTPTTTLSASTIIPTTAKIEIKAKGSVEEIKTLLQQLLSFFTNLVKA